MSKFKVGDIVRVISPIGLSYKGRYRAGDICEVLETSSIDVVLKGDTEHEGCYVSNRFLELIESPVQYKDKPPTHPDIYVIDEWKKGAKIQARSTQSAEWYAITNCPSMYQKEYRVDPECIVQPVCNKARTKELLDAIQSAKDELQSMSEGK